MLASGMIIIDCSLKLHNLMLYHTRFLQFNFFKTFIRSSKKHVCWKVRLYLESRFLIVLAQYCLRRYNNRSDSMCYFNVYERN